MSDETKCGKCGLPLFDNGTVYIHRVIAGALVIELQDCPAFLHDKPGHFIVQGGFRSPTTTRGEPAMSETAREWILNRFGKDVGGVEICHYTEKGERHSEHWLNLQAFADSYKEYSSHVLSKVAKKAAEEIAKERDTLNDAYSKQVEHTNFVRDEYQKRLKKAEQELAEVRKALEEAWEPWQKMIDDGKLAIGGYPASLAKAKAVLSKHEVKP